LSAAFTAHKAREEYTRNLGDIHLVREAQRFGYLALLMLDMDYVNRHVGRPEYRVVVVEPFTNPQGNLVGWFPQHLPGPPWITGTQ
jgi:hypothetical protein